MSAAKKIDPYAELGVSRSASKADVKAAYRRRSKKEHPDAGGSAERFAALTLARDVLQDDDRRARYDATGEIDGGVNNALSDALQTALQAIFLVIGNIEENGLNPETFDIVGDAVERLHRLRGEMASDQGKLRAQAVQLRRMATRFRAKEGKTSRLGPLLEGQALDRERAAEDGDRKREAAKQAIEILEEHTFDYERADVRQHMRAMQASVFSQIFGGSTV